MAIKYIKSSHSDPLSEGVMGKMRLSVNGEDTENIWVKRFEGYSVLQNHALNLFPFESWGAVIPSTESSYDLEDYRNKMEIELHPEAWEEYLKANIIKEDGTFIKPDDRPKQLVPEANDTVTKEEGGLG